MNNEMKNILKYWDSILQMKPASQTFFLIMLFYFIISFLMMPAIYYFINRESLSAAGDGFAVGSLISVVLWLLVGRYMI